VAAQALTAGAATIDRIRSVKLASITLPLATPISDAKVFTGRQKPMTEVALLFAEVRTEDDHEGIGFSYSKRAGGPGQFAHAQEIAPALIGEDPSDIGKIWTKLVWAGASVGRSGLSTQSIAAFDVALWDLKAKRASLPLAKLLGAYRDSVRTYNTSGGFLHAPIDQVMENSTHALSSGIGGIKIKVGQPDWKPTSPGSSGYGNTWAMTFHSWSMPISSGTGPRRNGWAGCSSASTWSGSRNRWMPMTPTGTPNSPGRWTPRSPPARCSRASPNTSDSSTPRPPTSSNPMHPRIGGITQFLKLAALAEAKHLELAPHFAMEIHVHLAAAYPIEPWVEHFDWLDPLFNERLEIKDGRMHVSDRPGLGFTLSDQADAWTVGTATFGTP